VNESEACGANHPTQSEPSNASTGQRIGLFGLLGTGNLGNDGSLATVLEHLRAAHPDATLHAFCAGPAEVDGRFHVPAVRMNWNRTEYQTAGSLWLMVRKGLGKLVDPFRTAAWVRRQDVVIVPGMGVLESTQPVRPWGFPYSLLLLSLCGRLFRTPVVLLSVGASVVENRVTRAVMVRAARLASYRSFRDELSREAMRAMGVDTDHDPVYADLVLSSFEPPPPAERGGIVGVGVMNYRGGDTERARGDEIHRAYLDRMTAFVRRLVDDGRRVRLFTGDRTDKPTAEQIAARVSSAAVEIAELSTLDDLAKSMAEVDTVVATRYHNVISALTLGKPTISLGYAAKNDVLMARMGLGEYCQHARDFDVDRLLAQFDSLQERHDELVAMLAARNADAAWRVGQQLDELSALIRRSTKPREAIS
jgi:polysaccharide pyruvyl transferase WcaK-like protein